MTRVRHGFTLLELMAVVMIMGVILLAIVPAVDSLIPGYKLSSSAREVASHIELVQGQAISTRRQYLLVYDLDERTYWIVFPKEEDEDAEVEPELPDPQLGGGELRPTDDLEHGPPPPTDDELEEPDEVPTELDLDEREALEPEELPEGIEFIGISMGDEERTTGKVVVPFTHLGDLGGHMVGLRLADDNQTEQWIKFNPLSRSIDYSETRPEVRTLEGTDQ